MRGDDQGDQVLERVTIGEREINLNEVVRSKGVVICKDRDDGAMSLISEGDE